MRTTSTGPPSFPLFFDLQVLLFSVVLVLCLLVFLWFYNFVTYCQTEGFTIVTAMDATDLEAPTQTNNLPTGKFTNLMYLLKAEMKRNLGLFSRVIKGPFLRCVASTLVSCICSSCVSLGLLAQSFCCLVRPWSRSRDKGAFASEIELTSNHGVTQPLIGYTALAESLDSHPDVVEEIDIGMPRTSPPQPQTASSQTLTERSAATSTDVTFCLLLRVIWYWFVGLLVLLGFGYQPLLSVSGYLEQRCYGAQIHLLQRWPSADCLTASLAFCAVAYGIHLPTAPILPGPLQGGEALSPALPPGTMRGCRTALEEGARERGCWDGSRANLSGIGASIAFAPGSDRLQFEAERIKLSANACTHGMRNQACTACHAAGQLLSMVSCLQLRTRDSIIGPGSRFVGDEWDALAPSATPEWERGTWVPDGEPTRGSDEAVGDEA